MKILLTGKNGQLGQEFLKQASIFGHTVLAYTKEELDIADHTAIKKEIKAVKPDIVVNTAVIHASVESELHPARLFAINSIALKNMASVCRKISIPFLTYSSDYVFDGKKGSPYAESDQQNPTQLFGISKYMGEIMALNYNDNSIVIRTCGVYGGVSGSRSKGNFVLNILEEAKKLNMIEVSSEQIVNPTYAVDLVRCTYQLLDKEPTSGIYHLASDGYCSWAKFSETIMNLARLKVKVAPVNRNGMSGGINRPLFSALKNTKAKKLGIMLPSWEDSIQRYLAYLESHHE